VSGKMSNYNLKVGINLDGRTLYNNLSTHVSISTKKYIAKTHNKDNYIVEENNKGYYHYVDSDDNEVIGIFYEKNVTNLSNFKLPADFGTITEVNETAVLYEHLLRASHEKVYVVSEDFGKQESLPKGDIETLVDETVRGYGVPFDSILGFDGEESEIPEGYILTDNPNVRIDAQVVNTESTSSEEVYSCYYINQKFGELENILDVINGEVI
jgi:hypothetical protein